MGSRCAQVGEWNGWAGRLASAARASAESRTDDGSVYGGFLGKLFVHEVHQLGDSTGTAEVREDLLAFFLSGVGDILISTVNLAEGLGGHLGGADTSASKIILVGDA